jgi:hypothetical protein
VAGNLRRHDVAVISLSYSNKYLGAFDASAFENVLIDSVSNNSPTFILLAKPSKSFALQIDDSDMVTIPMHQAGKS